MSRFDCKKFYPASVAVAFVLLLAEHGALGQANQYYALAPCRIVDTRVPNAFQIAPRNTTSTPLTAYYPPSTETWWPGPYDPLNPVGIRVRRAPLYDNSRDCGIPTTATGISVNVSVVNASVVGYLTMWPTDATFPTVAIMIVGQNESVTSNSAIIRLGTYSAGNPDMYVRLTKGSGSGTGHLAVDVTGYLAP